MRLAALALALAGPAASAAPEAPREEIMAFILPHSHDDVGWVRTVDEYYDFFVHDYYASSVEALQGHPERRFQVVEQAYFSRFWDGASEEQREQVRDLIANDQLGFAVGGWVMPDEAVTDYADLVETMTIGHEWLRDTLNVTVKFGFQVDPFGASSLFARVSAELGFDAHVISRINYWTKDDMQQSQQLQFVWRPTDALPGTEIFTHVMDQYSYCTPGEGDTHFYWDGDDSKPAEYWAAHPDEIANATSSFAVNETNVQAYADYLVGNVQERAAWFRTPHVLWPFGCDFQNFNAPLQFDNMDAVMAYVAAHPERYPGVSLRYATLDEYFQAVHDADETWGCRGADDFLPYLSGDVADPVGSNRAWTGFYASHEHLKGSSRRASALLRAADAAGRLSPADTEALREAVATLPHHDSVTGTAGLGDPFEPTPYNLGQIVAMYERLLTKGSEAVSEPLGGDPDPAAAASLLAQGRPAAVVAYNALGWDLDDAWLRLEGLPRAAGAAAPAACQWVGDALYVRARLPAGGRASLQLLPDAADRCPAAEPAAAPPQIPDVSMWVYHDVNLTSPEGQAGAVSGAYVFRPLPQPATPLDDAFADGPRVSALAGAFVNETRVQVSPDTSVVLRTFADQPALTEAYLTVGPLEGNREAVWRLDTGLDTAVPGHPELRSEFRSDNNGAQMQRRYFNATLAYNGSDAGVNLGSNFVPLVRAADLTDRASGARLAVLSSRAHGVSSPAPGRLEVLVARRVLQDDWLGACGPGPLQGPDCPAPVPMNVTNTVDATFWLWSGTEVEQERASQRLNNPPQLFFGASPATETGLAQPLPDRVHLLSLRPLDDSGDLLLLRLQHLGGAPATVDVRAVLGRPLQSMSARTINGVSPVDTPRWAWKSTCPAAPPSGPVVNGTTVSLREAEIATLLVELSP